MSVIIALLVRGEQLWDLLCGNEDWQKFLKILVTYLANKAKESDTSSLPAPLPSLARAAAPQQPSSHLARCCDVDASLVVLAQQALQALECVPLKPHDTDNSNVYNRNNYSQSS